MVERNKIKEELRDLESRKFTGVRGNIVIRNRKIEEANPS